MARHESRRARSVPRTAWRLAPMLVALVALFANIGRLAHQLVVAHTVCEHGQLVDGHDRPDAHPDESEDERERVHAEPVSPPAHDDSHEHCDVASLVHGLAVETPVVPAASLLPCFVGLPGEARAAESPLSPLDRAPKASPPRA